MSKIVLLILLSNLASGVITAQTNKDSAAILVRQASVLRMKSQKLQALAKSLGPCWRSIILSDSAIVLNNEALALIYRAIGKLNQPQ